MKYIALFLTILIPFIAAAADFSPHVAILAEPWDWFFSLHWLWQVLLAIFFPLIFYLVLRLFYKIVEAILGVFKS